MHENKGKAVNESKVVNIGGVDQYILFKGDDKEKPVLLLLHGGPGAPLSFIHSIFPKELEENFIVAYWDQRGAGHSFSESIPPESMNIEQFISDTIEVTDYILNKFSREKIYILGFSWGSVLGINAVHQHPEKYYAYIGMSQVVDNRKGEEISYKVLLEEAKNQNNTEAIHELETIGRPPYKGEDDLLVQKWLREFGFSERKINSAKFYGENCSEEEMGQIINGVGFTEANILAEVLDYNIHYISEMKIPVYISMGRYDYQTPSVLAEEFYKTLRAPKKEFTWFEESAHATALEEPEKFVEVLLKVLNQTYR